MNVFLRMAAAVVAALIVVACGGGGGGSSPVTPTADITVDNALVITQEVMATASLAEVIGDQTGLGPLSVTASASAGSQVLSSVIDIGMGHFSAEITAQASAVTPQFREDCQLGGWVDVDPISNNSVELTFTDCNGYGDGDLDLLGVINGIMKLTLNSEEPLDITVEFNGFTVAGDFAEPFSADGLVGLRFEDLSNPATFNFLSTLIFRNFVAVLDDGLLTISFPRYDYTIEEFTSGVDDWIKQDLSGSSEGDGISFSGIVNVNTVIPFKYDFNVGDFGAYTEGKIFISGAGGKEIHIEVIELPSPAGGYGLLVEIDTDGDGEYDYFPDWTMDQITSLGF